MVSPTFFLIRNVLNGKRVAMKPSRGTKAYRHLLCGRSIRLWILLVSVASGGFHQALAAAPVTKAQWIWPSETREANQTACFRKSFSLDKPVQRATLRGFADFNRISVYLNGRRVIEVEDYARPCEIDVRQFLQPGENLLAVRGVSSAGPAAMAIELEMTLDESSLQTVVTDASWLTTLSTKEGWHSSSFQPIGWNAASNFGDLAAEPCFASTGNAGISELDDYTQWKQALGAKTVADPATFMAPDGFQIELLRAAAPGEDSWISMTFDPRGRLIVAKESQGLLRMTLPKDDHEIQVEIINDTLKECRGLLSAYGSLYVNANESKGLYRLRDTDGDDKFDETTLLYSSVGSSGHGRNDLALGPDGLIYAIHGDSVELPKSFGDLTSPFRENRRGVKTREGHVIRMDRDGKKLQLVAAGLRNPYGIDFNADGEMFTYDADAEHDMGAPWYRPTRVDHLVSGADYGWRGVTGSWPPYYPDHPDTGLPNLDIGKGSPTGVKFGTHSNFPSQYRNALFILDWSYGRVVCVYMTPRGASYVCRAETFVKGRPLNVTDLEFGPDGALYFVTGGRKTQSGLYRVRYVGLESPASPPTQQPLARNEHAVAARAQRHKLESLHGRQDTRAIDEAWPHLDSPDPWIRHAARIAIEHQPLADWQARALTESHTTAALTGLLALARSGVDGVHEKVVRRLGQLPLEEWSSERQLVALYSYELCQPYLKSSPETAISVAQRLDRLYPHESTDMNQSLSKLLGQLESPHFVRKTLDLLAGAATEREQLHYLFVLSQSKQAWHLDDRKTFLVAFQRAEQFQGGEGMPKFLRQIKADWEKSLSDSERSALLALSSPKKSILDDQAAPPVTRPLVKEWKVDDLADSLTAVAQGRNFAQGKAMYATLCIRCHRVGHEGAAIGPDLTAVSRRFSRRDMLESIIAPSKVIAEQYRNVQVITFDGRIVVGRVVPSTDFRSPALRIATNLLDIEQITEIAKDQIESHAISELSPMPQGLLNSLTSAEIFDLLAYIETAGDPRSRNFQP
jgi:putative heme-binding domain-containing protein